MADPAREKLIEAVAESDDALIEKYLERARCRGRHHPRRQGRLRQRAPRTGPRRLGLAGDRDRPAPRLHRRGVPLADRARADRRDREGRRGEGARLRSLPGRSPRSSSRPCPTPSWATSRCSGCSAARCDPTTSRRDAADERIGQLFALKGKEHETLAEVTAGDIGAVAKLQHTHTGDTFDQGRPGAARGRGAPRTAPRVRDRTEDQGRGGSSRDGPHPPSRRTRRSASRGTTRPTRR